MNITWNLLVGNRKGYTKMTREEGESYVGNVYSNKSHWNKNMDWFVKIIAYNDHNQKFYTQNMNSGVVNWVDTVGNGEWFECGGIWLKIDLKDPVID